MRRVRLKPAKSLALRVIISTLLLSFGVISLTGSALNSKLSAGIKKVNLDTSIIEARSIIFDAQYQFAISLGKNSKSIMKIVEKIVNTTTSLSSYENPREIVLIRDPKNKKIGNNYELTSNLTDPQSIPENLRKQVLKNKTLGWSYTRLQYLGIGSSQALAIGDEIVIPNSGVYQMYVIFSLANQNTTLALIKNSLYLTGFALLLLIALIIWLVIRQVVRPVKEAARIATNFTSGDFSQRMIIESADELAALGNSFNEMADSLEKQIRRLENLSRVQQRFVSDVSHELRTPLTTLRLASEVINTARLEFEPNVSRSTELLIAQLDRFERLLEDLLEVSRFDAEVAVLESTDFDIVELVNKCTSDLAMVAGESSTTMRVITSQNLIIINADIRRIERVLRNLLSNAIEHCEGKPIEISILADDLDVAIAVRDFGVGLDKVSLGRVFDRFWRADPSRARIRGGTGLGLSIALEDARLHNGELDAWGQLGQGSNFVLSLPRKVGEMINSRLINSKPPSFAG